MKEKLSTTGLIFFLIFIRVSAFQTFQRSGCRHPVSQLILDWFVIQKSFFYYWLRWRTLRPFRVLSSESKQLLLRITSFDQKYALFHFFTGIFVNFIVDDSVETELFQESNGTWIGIFVTPTEDYEARIYPQFRLKTNYNYSFGKQQKINNCI